MTDVDLSPIALGVLSVHCEVKTSQPNTRENRLLLKAADTLRAASAELERLRRELAEAVARDCPRGEDCDATAAYMAGSRRGAERMRRAIEDMHERAWNREAAAVDLDKAAWHRECADHIHALPLSGDETEGGA